MGNTHTVLKYDKDIYPEKQINPLTPHENLENASNSGTKDITESGLNNTVRDNFIIQESSNLLNILKYHININSIDTGYKKQNLIINKHLDKKKRELETELENTNNFINIERAHFKTTELTNETLMSYNISISYIDVFLFIIIAIGLIILYLIKSK